MKIAIMTLPIGTNYGGIMQAFALQKVLKDMNHDVTTIDYNIPEPSFFYEKVRTAYRLSRKITGKYKRPIYVEKNKNYVLKNTLNFINQNISLSERITNTKDLKRHFKRSGYDAVIVGSDQTWRPKYSPNIYNFYLSFLKKNKNIKRIAYASSFGVDNWEYSKEETKKCVKLIKLFDAVSVREQSGINLCNERLGVDSEFVLDPTLLLYKKDYLNLIGSKYNSDKSEGVFTYFLDNNESKVNTAQLIANKLSTHTYSCQAEKDVRSLEKYTIDDYVMPMVEDWLASFANASFIITDSFHGMIFSIIFEKPFVIIVNKERGSARFESLLKSLGGMHHLYYECRYINEDISKVISLKPLDEYKLLTLKNKSLDFLRNTLEAYN